jgi:hypothetical protein
MAVLAEETMRRATLLYLAACFLLAGCNQPAVTLKPPAFQSSENTALDWNDVAHTIAFRMASLGLVPAYPSESAAPAAPSTAVFVRTQAVDSAFIRQVADELEADILRRRGTITRSPVNATVVNLDVTFIRWGPRDKPPGLLGTTLGILAIPPTVIAASAPMSTWTAADAAVFTALGLGVFMDGLIALTPTMNAEAVWQATIVNDDKIVMRLQEPIYVRALDPPLYAKETSLAPAASWSSATPLRQRTIRYDP